MEPRKYNLPRNVRPSFVRIDCDGKKTPTATGPAARNGKLAASFAVRQDGGILDDAVEVIITPAADGGTTRIVVRAFGETVADRVVAQ